MKSKELYVRNILLAYLDKKYIIKIKMLILLSRDLKTIIYLAVISQKPILR